MLGNIYLVYLDDQRWPGKTERESFCFVFSFLCLVIELDWIYRPPRKSSLSSISSSSQSKSSSMFEKGLQQSLSPFEFMALPPRRKPTRLLVIRHFNIIIASTEISPSCYQKQFIITNFKTSWLWGWSSSPPPSSSTWPGSFVERWGDHSLASLIRIPDRLHGRPPS